MQFLWRLISILLCWAILLPFELLWPVRKLPRRRLFWDLRYTFLTFPITLAIYGVVLHWILPSPAGTSFQSVLYSPLAERVPPLPLQGVFQAMPCPALSFLLVSLLLADFLFYWTHRALHKFSFLWPVHKLHHMNQDLHSMAQGVGHILDGPLTAIAFGIPTVWLVRSVGVVPVPSNLLEAAAVFFLELRVLFWFHHANWRLNMGPFTRVLTGPQVHRIHHSIEDKHHDKNFAALFPIWDILFGTYYHPAKDEWPETGIAGEAQPETQIRAVIVPFLAWGALIKGAVTRAKGKSVPS